MRKFIIALSTLSIIACKNKEQKDYEPGLLKTIENAQSLNKGADTIKDYENKTAELKKLKPVDNAVYKAVLTKSLGDLKRSTFSAGRTSTLGLRSGEANYGEPAGKSIKVTIFDGAGEAGSALIAATHMTIATDMESKEGTTIKQTEEFDGHRCMTETDSNPASYKSSTLTFIYKDRFQISLEGKKIQLEELKTYLKKLDLSKLNQ